MLLAPCGWRVRILDWRLSQPGFDPSYRNLCLATLMSSDRTKQISLWMTIYIYIYIHTYTHTHLHYKYLLSGCSIFLFPFLLAENFLSANHNKNEWLASEISVWWLLYLLHKNDSVWRIVIPYLVLYCGCLCTLTTFTCFTTFVVILIIITRAHTHTLG